MMSKGSKDSKKLVEDLGELLFRRAADSCVDGVAIVTLDREIVYVNEARARMHGYAVSELIGKDVAILTSEEFDAPSIAAHVLETGSWKGELLGVRQDCSTIPARQAITRVDDAEGHPVAMLSITRDITEEQRAHRELAEAEEQYRDLVENAIVAVYRTTVDGKILYVNDAAVRLFGAESREEFMRRPVLNIYARPEDREAFVERLRAEGSVSGVEVPMHAFPGEPRTVLLSATLKGDVISGMGVDITELRKAEAAQQAVREESERVKKRFYRETIFSVTDGKLVICDPEEIDKLHCEPVFPRLQISEPSDVSMARGQVRTVAGKAGMDPSRVDDLVLCAGEATTNALKHSGGGTVCVCDVGDSIHVRVSDSGPGMDSLALPRLTLMKGYSTKQSLGMGYASILALADTVYLSTGPSGTTVVIMMQKQPVTSAPKPEDLPDLW